MTKITAIGAGSTLPIFPRYGQAIMIPKLSPPIKATVGTMLAKLEGIAMIVGIIFPEKVTPSSEWVCFDIMMMPIPANMPCTTFNGNMFVSLPSLAKGRTMRNRINRTSRRFWHSVLALEESPEGPDRHPGLSLLAFLMT